MADGGRAESVSAVPGHRSANVHARCARGHRAPPHNPTRSTVTGVPPIVTGVACLSSLALRYHRFRTGDRWSTYAMVTVCGSTPNEYRPAVSSKLMATTSPVSALRRVTAASSGSPVEVVIEPWIVVPLVSFALAVTVPPAVTCTGLA